MIFRNRWLLTISENEERSYAHYEFSLFRTYMNNVKNCHDIHQNIYKVTWFDKKNSIHSWSNKSLKSCYIFLNFKQGFKLAIAV